MPKWKNSYESGRKFKRAWEREFPWIKKHSVTSEDAYCKICEKTVAPRKDAITQHSQTKEHKEKVFARSNSSKLTSVYKTIPKIEDSVRKAELCCHTRMLAVDHIGEIVKRNGDDSNIGKIKLHRTKCSRLVDTVIAPCLKDELKADLKGKKYSVLDELTDRSTPKHFCICVRYFSEKKKCIESALLSLVPVVSTTGECLFGGIKRLFWLSLTSVYLIV